MSDPHTEMGKITPSGERVLDGASMAKSENPLARIQTENRIVLSNSEVRVETSNRGATIRELSYMGTKLTRDVAEGETPPGEKGGLFCCPIIFARVPDRTLHFEGERYELQYPKDIDADLVDPDKLMLHGYEHYFTWQIARQEENLVRYELSKERMPNDFPYFDSRWEQLYKYGPKSPFPFPHSSFVEYALNGSELTISVGIFNCDRPTPAMLTLHPFFKFFLDDAKESPCLMANLLQKFEYPKNAKLPMSYQAPVDLANNGPFSQFTPLPLDLDHSFVSDGAAAIRWPNGITLEMRDETLRSVCAVSPLQLWTTGVSSRNAFGVEQGGPANLFYLVEEGRVPKDWLPVCDPGKEISRTVKYTLSRSYQGST